jgi:Kef-type K+ transport system membrane component KefB
MTTLLLIAVAAVVAAVVSAHAPGRLVLPTVVIELLLGILIGPVLGLAHRDATVEVLSNIGLAFLFFLAGMEIDLQRLRGAPLRLGVLGWLGSLAMAVALTALLGVLGMDLPPAFVTVALCTTALGTLVPIWRDAGVLDTPLGQYGMAAGVCGELLPIVALTAVLTGSAHRAVTALALVAFVLVVVACVVVALRWRPAWAARLAGRTMHLSSQLPIRCCVVVLVGFATLATELGLDVILGAFAAGLVVGLALPEEARDGVLSHKLDALGFGFLVPVFFVAGGMAFDLHALLADRGALLLIPLFLALLLVVRGVPALLYGSALPARERLALACFSATSLPLIVAVTTLGVADGRLTTQTAAAMVAAATLSVLLLPLAGLLLVAPDRLLAGPQVIDTISLVSSTTGGERNAER